jgi:hypothetical protein
MNAKLSNVNFTGNHDLKYCLRSCCHSGYTAAVILAQQLLSFGYRAAVILATQLLSYWLRNCCHIGYTAAVILAPQLLSCAPSRNRR